MERKSIPSQAINAYIFPGVGMGIVASGSKLVTNEMFLAAARTLADQVSKGDRAEERIYPPISRIREVSIAIVCATAEIAYRRGLARCRNRLICDRTSMLRCTIRITRVTFDGALRSISKRFTSQLPARSERFLRLSLRRGLRSRRPAPCPRRKWQLKLRFLFSAVQNNRWLSR
ncbi:MAG: hypothetical protein JO170_04930 [Verrucomicrobia bacterium]|nr:hypothetical protein [Verrucomicrobiota bacterium]